MCTCKGWSEAASHPALWRELAKLDFGLDAAATAAAIEGEHGTSSDSDVVMVGPDGLRCDSPRAAYRSWRLYRSKLGLTLQRQSNLPSIPADAVGSSLHAFKVPLAEARLRMLRAWSSLDAFYARELPAIAASLRAPVAPADWEVTRTTRQQELCFNMVHKVLWFLFTSSVR